MFERILVPLDGSELAEKAIPYAVRLAKMRRGRIYLLRAAETPMVSQWDGLDVQLSQVREAESELQAAAERIARAGLTAEPHVYPDGPIPSIRQAVEAHAVDTIVMTTHGRGGLGRWLYGSVAEGVVRTVELPILLVPAACEREWQAGHESSVIVPLDGSALSEEALGPAVELARSLGAGLRLVEVVEPPAAIAYTDGPVYPVELLDVDSWLKEAKDYLTTVTGRLDAKQLDVQIETTVGHPASTIARIAHENNAAAIVMATHGRTGLARVVMGSVASGILQRVEVPVLVVRPTAAARPAVHPEEPLEEQVRTGIALQPSEIELIRQGLQLLLAVSTEEKDLAEPINHILQRLRGGEIRISSPVDLAASQKYSA